jgi:hypothetical protein
MIKGISRMLGWTNDSWMGVISDGEHVRGKRSRAALLWYSIRRLARMVFDDVCGLHAALTRSAFVIYRVFSVVVTGDGGVRAQGGDQRGRIRMLCTGV